MRESWWPSKRSDGPPPASRKSALLTIGGSFIIVTTVIDDGVEKISVAVDSRRRNGSTKFLKMTVRRAEVFREEGGAWGVEVEKHIKTIFIVPRSRKKHKNRNNTY